MSGVYKYIIDFISNDSKFKKGLADVQKSTKAAEVGVGRLAGTVKNDMLSAGNAMSSFVQGDVSALPRLFSSATSSAGVFSKALKGVKAVLISTGIGAIIVAIGAAVGALTRYFKGTEEGQIVFKKVMNNVKAYTEPVLQLFGNFGKALVHLFKGEFSQAWDTAKEALKGVDDQIKVNKSNLEELNKLEEDFIKDKRKYLLENKKLEADVAKARLKAENEEMYTAEQRLKFADEAIAKQKKLAENKTKLAKQELRIEEIKASFGDNDIATNDKLAELKSQQFDIMREQDQSLRRMSETQQRISKEVAKETEERQKILDASKNVSFSTIETKKVTSIGGSVEMDTSQLGDMSGIVARNLELVESLRTGWTSFGEDFSRIMDTMAANGENITGVHMLAADMVNDLMGLAYQGADSMAEWAASVKDAAMSAINAFIAEGVAGAVSKTLSFLPFPINMVMGAAAAAAATGLLNSVIPKFELGGVVPGHSFYGDKMLIRANSGEEVLRRDDPRHRDNVGRRGGGSRDRLIIPTTRLRKGDIYISYHEAEREILSRT